MTETKNNRVSMGRSVSEPTCRTCDFRKADGSWHGWCQHPDNRTPPSPGWPTGFTPSVTGSGGCDLHLARA